MFYHWLAPLGQTHIIFNLFNYLSFRAAGAMVTALLIAFLVGPGIIRRLREKKVGQVIRAEGPASHQGKRGTPTMGGIIILLATVIPTLLWARVDSRNVLFALLAILWTGGIGFIDDYLGIRKRRNLGLRKRGKTLGIVGIALVFGVLAIEWVNVPTTLSFTRPLDFDLGSVGFIIWTILIVYATANAVNFTDGLDTLAAGTAAIAFVAYAIIAYRQGQLGVVTFCFTMVGALMGFLWFNAHPAQVIMGDTGSLAIGASLAVAAFMTGQWLLLPVVGAVFLAEAASVSTSSGFNERGSMYSTLIPALAIAGNALATSSVAGAHATSVRSRPA